MDREQEKERMRRRRNDVNRVRAYYRRMYREQWSATLWFLRMRGDDAEAWIESQVAMRERTGCPCSCAMCGHRRDTEGLTFQERKFLDDMRSQMK